jgi:hypothetical protein
MYKNDESKIIIHDGHLRANVYVIRMRQDNEKKALQQNVIDFL